MLCGFTLMCSRVNVCCSEWWLEGAECLLFNAITVKISVTVTLAVVFRFSNTLSAVKLSAVSTLCFSVAWLLGLGAIFHDFSRLFSPVLRVLALCQHDDKTVCNCFWHPLTASYSCLKKQWFGWGTAKALLPPPCLVPTVHARHCKANAHSAG